MQEGKSMGTANLLEGVPGSKSSGISGSSVSQKGTASSYNAGQPRGAMRGRTGPVFGGTWRNTTSTRKGLE